MYVILVYDVDVSRVNKLMKLCRRFLFHIQNSVFEGEITESNLTKLKLKIKNVIDEGYDSVIIFEFESFNPKFAHKEIIGVEKRPTDFII
ncbi:CRISPR-associated endonuclease Cas2 [Candidatus Micrarchaeota archaeon]|nr:CRISPR-associated endonuclease Cas2 [Candidatus Micrarchaeota archaeon]